MEIHQSPCHNSLVKSMLTAILEIVLVYMHQLEQLKQATELTLSGDIHLGPHFTNN